MAGFDENINIDVYRFREIVRSLFNGLNLSDGAILNRIEENRRELFEYYCFKSDLENLIGKDLTNGNAIAEIKRLQEFSMPIDIHEISQNANEMREKEFDMLTEEVTKLKNDLRIANKVIARLVGE